MKDDSANTVVRSKFRDELNFAEFPLAALSDHTTKGQKTLVFSDRIFDKGKNAPVSRTLTISASDEYGLPTALDDELILGLIQLSNRQGFTDRKVHFTRYELIKLLGWRDESKSYERVSQSLKRWLGVTLYYEKAWWSKEEQCWVDENFHLLDQVTIYDRDRRDRKLRANPTDPFAGMSSFLWNDVVFTSFKSGYLKQIDHEFFKTLKSAISKRIYRFLDKRFYQRASLEFGLREFACEHIGLSRNYINPEIKRKLRPAIRELEEKGFLKPLSEERRYVGVSKGEWKIVFEKAGAIIAPSKEEADSKMSIPEKPESKRVPLNDKDVEALVSRGISKGTARKLVSTLSRESIREKIEVFDWLLERKDTRVSKNPPGFLYKAIAEDFAPPKDFLIEKERGQEKAKETAPSAPSVSEIMRAKAESLEKERRRVMDEFWASLSEEEKVSFEKEALQMTDKFLRRQYEDNKERAGALFRAARQTILDQHIERMLEGREAA